MAFTPPPVPHFRTMRQFMGPSWLTSTGESELVGYVLDLLKDGFVERLRQGLLARLPQNDPTGVTTAPNDALAAMGRDRRIVRGRNETAQSYAQRLVTWLDSWQVAGNPFSIMQQLASWAGPIPSWRTVDVRGNWFSRAANGTLSVSLNQANWDWDAAPDALTRWSRFWVICYPNGLWTAGPTWGVPAKWGTPGRTWGSTAQSDDVATMRSLVSDWKPAGTQCVNIILAFDPTSFNPATARDGAGLPNGLWGSNPTITGGQYVASRLSTARFLDGV